VDGGFVPDRNVVCPFHLLHKLCHILAAEKHVIRAGPGLFAAHVPKPFVINFPTPRFVRVEPQDTA